MIYPLVANKSVQAIAVSEPMKFVPLLLVQILSMATYNIKLTCLGD